jgi:hypothetical protein
MTLCRRTGCAFSIFLFFFFFVIFSMGGNISFFFFVFFFLFSVGTTLDGLDDIPQLFSMGGNITMFPLLGLRTGSGVSFSCQHLSYS